MGDIMLIRPTPAVLIIKLNRAEKRNALSAELVEALHEAIDSAPGSDTRVLVFEGNGKNFSAGFDFTNIDTASQAEISWRFIRIQQLLQKIATTGLLTVALAHGRNFGAGVDLIAACSWRICTPESSFRMPGLKFGLVLGTGRFSALVGAQKAREILEASQTFDAGQALEMGFATQVLEQGGWTDILGQAEGAALNLSPVARGLLCQALGNHDHDRDMALLVASLSVPGLKQRIQAYLQ